MTPKEKAQELIQKFNYHVEKKDFLGDNVEQQDTKQCALIAVDEIIEILWIVKDCESEYRFWQEVKSEIQKI